MIEPVFKDRYWDGIQTGYWCGDVNSNTLKTKRSPVILSVHLHASLTQLSLDAQIG